MKIAIEPFRGEFRVVLTPDTPEDRLEVEAAYGRCCELGVDSARQAGQPGWLTLFVERSPIHPPKPKETPPEAKETALAGK